MTDRSQLSVDPSLTRPTLGFVILSHHLPEQLLRLVRTLGTMFGDPPTVCHHDNHQCSLDRSHFPACVRFVRNPIRTRWGDFSLIEAMLAGVRLMCEVADPDWVALLSGQDYPIKPAERILDTLRGTPYNALIRCEHLDPDAPANNWQRRCVHRYFRTHVRLPYINRRGRPRFDLVGLPRLLSKPFVPFNDDFRCYVGGQWFVADRSAVAALLKPTVESRRLQRHYRRVFCADESYVQCILANRSDLAVSGGQPHHVAFHHSRRNPDTLTVSDLPQLIATDRLFARKMNPETSAQLLDELDNAIVASRKGICVI